MKSQNLKEVCTFLDLNPEIDQIENVSDQYSTMVYQILDFNFEFANNIHP